MTDRTLEILDITVPHILGSAEAYRAAKAYAVADGWEIADVVERRPLAPRGWRFTFAAVRSELREYGGEV